MVECYLVGGAVRDGLLGYPVIEQDWVVVGQTPAAMLAAGFIPVGKDFPVFLHPKTHEEYALARTERKIGPGYKGFSCYAASDVTLVQDLQRRDLTINAMAQASDGALIDPYGGQRDLNQRVLRHVSPAFREDPVRILRVARFAARYSALGFHVAPETLTLMQEMVQAGEVDALVAERVWQETDKALGEKHPAVFFQVLATCGALVLLWPELDKRCYEDDLAQGAPRNANKYIRFALLMHRLPLDAIKHVATRYKIGRIYQNLAVQVAAHYPLFRDTHQLSAQAIATILESLDAIRRPNDTLQWIAACEVLQQLEKGGDSAAKLWQNALAALRNVDITPLLQQGLSGAALKQPIHDLRVSAVAKVINE